MDTPSTLCEIFTFENLLYAYKKAVRCKRKKKAAIAFRENLYQNIDRITRTFAKGKYPPIIYHCFTIYEPKQREVRATSFEMRVIQNCFCEEYLIPFFEKFLSDRNAACRKGMGTDYARKLLKSDLEKMFVENKSNEIYYLKLDIHKYFKSIDCEILKSLVKEIMPENEMRDYLFYTIDSFTNGGLPLGNRTSQILALFYTSCLDEIAEKYFYLTNYVHYMDDFVILSNDMDQINLLLETYNTVLKRERKLAINEKTQIGIVTQGVGFLGWTFYLQDNGTVYMKRINSKYRTSKLHMKEAMFLYDNSKIDARNYCSRVCSILSSLDIGKAKGLKYKLIKMQYN